MARLPSHRHARPALRRLLLVGAAIVVGLLPAAHAYAAPSPAEIEQQIDKQWEQLEPVIEQYNKVRSQLKVNQKKSADLQKKIQPLSLQTEMAMSRVAELASRFYKTGPSSNLNALLTTGSPTTLAEQLTLLDRLAAHQRAEIAGVTAARDKFNAQKQKLDALIAAEKQQEAELAAKKKQIDAEIKRLTAMLPTTMVKAVGCPTITGIISSKANIAIKTACAQVGKPYVWGATGPNAFDCSGLTQYSYKAAGIYLTHYTGAQWRETKAISQSERRPGDLVFFYSDLHHVGLYIGNGLMVHASRAGKPVSVSSISYMPVAGFRRPY